MNLWWALLLEMSYWFGGGIIQYDPLEAVLLDDPIQATIGAELGCGPASVYASVATDMFMVGLTSYSPFFNTYTVGARMQYKGFTIGIEHACYHPMVPYGWVPSRSEVVPAFEGAMDRIYVQLKIKGGRK